MLLKINKIFYKIKIEKNNYYYLIKFIKNCFINFNTFFLNYFINFKLIIITNYLMYIIFYKLNIFIHIINFFNQQLLFIFSGSIFTKKTKLIEILKKIFNNFLTLTKINNNLPFTISTNANRQLRIFNFFTKKIENKKIVINYNFLNLYKFNGCRRKKKWLSGLKR